MAALTAALIGLSTAPALADETDPATATDTATAAPSEVPSEVPSAEPSEEAAEEPTGEPTDTPSPEPAEEPSEEPAEEPTATPSDAPSPEPFPEPSDGAAAQPEPDPGDAPVDGVQLAAAPEVAGITIDPEVAQARAGEAVVMQVWTQDADGNRLAEVTSESVLEFIGTNGSCTNVTCTANTTGLQHIKATWDGFTAFSSFNVEPGPPAGIEISLRDGVRVDPGDRFDVLTHQVDSAGNRVAEVAVEDMAYTPDPGIVCDDDGSCTAPDAGSYSITAHLKSDPTVTATMTVVVHAPREWTDHRFELVTQGELRAGQDIVVKLYASKGSGDEVDVTSDTSIRMRRVQDPWGNQVGGGAAIPCVGGTCRTTLAGTFNIWGTHDGQSGSIPDLEIGLAEPTELTLTPAIATIEAGTGAVFTPVLVDTFGNEAPTDREDVSFSTDPPASCTNGYCAARQPGRYEVRAAKDGQTATAELVVQPLAAAPPDQVARIDLVAVGGEGTGRVTAGTPGGFVTYAYAADGTPLGNVTANSRLSIEDEGTWSALGRTQSNSCTADTCTSTVAGQHTVTATWGTLTDTATLVVTPDGPAGFSVAPGAVTILAGETREFSIGIVDQFGNALQQFNSGGPSISMEFAASAGASCDGLRCGATKPGIYLVRLTSLQLDEVNFPIPPDAIQPAALRVLPGPVDAVVLTPGTATIDADETQAFTATGLDAHGNEVGDLTEATTFTASGTGFCEANTCGSAEGGTFTVTGVYVVPGAAGVPGPTGPAWPARVALAAAPGDTVTGTATLTVRGAPGTNPDPGTAPGTNPDDNSGSSGSAGSGAPAASGEGASRDAGPGALPATGAAVTWWQAATGLLLLLTGAAVIAGTRRRRGVPTP